MSKVLLILAHPAYQNSLANKAVVDKLKTLIPGMEISHIDKLYPDLKIDIKKEQEKLNKADCIILEFPMFWYNAPSSMRKYFEDVLQHGYAYGGSGNALKGKKLVVSMTMGAPDEVYKDKLAPQNVVGVGIEALCNLCNLKYEGIFATAGVMYFIKDKPDVLKKKMEELTKQAQKVADIAKKK